MEPGAAVASGLLGRAVEEADLENLLAGLGAGVGGARLIRGDAGIGKTALLETAARRASAAGANVLTTAGVPSESRLGFAGLHRLLAPRLGAIGELPEPQAAALSTAFGLGSEVAPDRFLIALATLELLADAAAEQPLVLIVEDTHWLDEDSWQVLTFVARRVEFEPIVILFAVREGYPEHREDSALGQMRLSALSPVASAELLDEASPDLSPIARRHVLDMAGGNPLALLELPRAADFGASSAASGVGPLPITARLERAFADQLEALPRATQSLLLVAAADDGSNLERILRAGSWVAGEPLTVDDLAPAEAAGLIRVGGEGIDLRHPLVGAAIYRGASMGDRMAAHTALAEVGGADPDRSAWHRAAACLGPDESVASALEAAAERALARGAPAVSAAAIERAAQLSDVSEVRGRRLLRAGEMEFELGRPDHALRLLQRAQSLELSRSEQAQLALLIETGDEESWSGPARVASSATLASEMVDPADPERSLGALLGAAQACWWGNPTPQTRALVLATADRIGVPDDLPAMVAIRACADPVGQGRETIERIARARLDPGPDPVGPHLLGTAATAVWSFEQSLGLLGVAVEGLRAQGRLGRLAQALVSQAWAAVLCANSTLAGSAADEASRLARETGQVRWAVAADLVRATLAGERGDDATLNALTTRGESELLSIGAQPLLAMVRFARGRAAVAHQNYEEGFAELRRALEPGDISYHRFTGAWGLADLVEAASHVADEAVTLSYLSELERLAEETGSPYLRASLDYVRPLVAADGDADRAFGLALRGEVSRWPCFHGRLQLAYGRWLRRHRRVAESRAPLRAARDGFDALGFGGLAERAREELRASGETSRSRGPDVRDRLTPQELQIAQLAAEGLSNREIGQRLYLSHRTVGSHLYRLFPKLGVSSRNHLGDALARLPAAVD
ncbi:AAA family ATPase [Thermoleophilia bacterium SCSIO 60948]|nr:AAA family ATPase [Thermoleophilia bacterium SCSIO 60948]